MEEDGTTSPPPRRQQNWRSAASVNWRLKDDTQRSEQSPQQQRGSYQRRENNEGENYGSPRNEGYGGGYNRQPREPMEIPTEVTVPKLYVGNLLYTASSSDIESFFVANGFQPTNISMSIDPATGRNPSYCFVDFDSVDEAKRALEQLNGQEVLGRGVRINPGVARKEGARREGGYGARPGWREGSDGQGYKSSTERYSNNNTGSSPQQWSRNSPSSGEQGKRIYVGGLPNMEQTTLEAEITQLFAPASIASISKLIAPHASKAGEPGDHHYLFVDLADVNDADALIERLNESVSPWSEEGQGKLKVNRAKEGGARRTGPGFGSSQREGQGERTFGRSAWRE